ncbi:MAG: hypothetical protein ACYTG5_01485 [Planctomycetota bacterium]|jgi:hypothetical protein
MKLAGEAFDGLRSRARTGIFVEAGAMLAVAFVIYAFASYTLDRGLELEVGVRAVLLLLCLTALFRILSKRLRDPLHFQLSDEEIALAVEREDPALRQSLVSAVQFEEALAGGGQVSDSPLLMRRSIDMVRGHLASIPFARAVNQARLQRYMGLLGASLLSLLIWGIAAPSEFRLWAMRNLAFSNEAWPKDTRLHFLDVAPGEIIRLAEREDLTLQVAADGVIPDTVNLRCEFSGGEISIREMDQVGAGTFSFTLETLLEPVLLRATGGDGETEVLEIQLVPRPKVIDLAITVQYPEYLSRESESIEDSGGDIRVPIGSAIELEARSSKKLTQANLTFGQDSRVDAELIDAGMGFRASISPDRDGVLRIDILDEDKLGPVQAPQLYVRLVEDQAPDLDFKTRGLGSMITPEAIIRGLVKARDDYGLKSLTASYRVSEITEGDVKPEDIEAEFLPADVSGMGSFRPGSDGFDAEISFDLKALSEGEVPDQEAKTIRPGQMLSFRLAATDYFSDDREGYSETLHFRVVSPEKLLEELRRRQEEQRRELERVLEREESATSELREITAPSEDDARGLQAGLRVAALSRGQVALGRRAQGIADSYAGILEEMISNRLFEPGDIRPIEAQIVSPLRMLAAEQFPDSADLTSAFAESGEDSTRVEAVALYESIEAVIRGVLDSMAKSESIAALVEALKLIIKTEAQASERVKALRNAEGEGIFGTPGKQPDKTKPGTGKKNK